MRYRSLQEEASALEAVIADRFPSLAPDELAEFCAAVLHKTADLYRDSGCVKLRSYDEKGRPFGERALLIGTGHPAELGGHVNT